MVTDVATNKKTYSDSVQMKVEKQRTWMQLILLKDTRNIKVSMLVCASYTEDLNSAQMKVSFATCCALIENVDPQQLERANVQMKKIIESSLRGLEVPAAMSLAQV